MRASYDRAYGRVAPQHTVGFCTSFDSVCVSARVATKQVTIPVDTAAARNAAFFLLSATVALIAFVFRGDKPQLVNVELLFLLGILLCTCTAYFVNVRAHGRTGKEVITDILETAGIALGGDFQIFVIRPNQEGSGTFGILCDFNLRDRHKYEGKLDFHLPGIREAYHGDGVVYHGPDEVGHTIEPNVKHRWIVPVPAGKTSKCILVVQDYCANLSKSRVEEIRDVLNHLARTIAKHDPGNLDVER